MDAHVSLDDLDILNLTFKTIDYRHVTRHDVVVPAGSNAQQRVVFPDLPTRRQIGQPLVLEA